MILEPIRDFVRDSYQLRVENADSLDSTAILTAAVALENRAIRYYGDAAERIRALPEVSRALKVLAKKRTQRLGQVTNISA
jgi:rubrerythrin